MSSDSRPAPPPPPHASWDTLLGSPEATMESAHRLGEVCQGGEVIGLVGELGAGKTLFVQGLARGLGVGEDEYVRSPTFTLIHEHHVRLPLHHVDLYRLEEPDEAAHIGYEDLFDGRAVVAIEWFDRFPELWPADRLAIRLMEIAPGQPGADRRRMEARAQGAKATRALRGWREAAQRARRGSGASGS